MDSLDDYQIPYGLMAEFDTPADVFCTLQRKCTLPATPDGIRIRRSRYTGWMTPWA